jgi:hypothetical protein
MDDSDAGSAAPRRVNAVDVRTVGGAGAGLKAAIGEDLHAGN